MIVLITGIAVLIFTGIIDSVRHSGFVRKLNFLTTPPCQLKLVR
jgi:hypothetical protein